MLHTIKSEQWPDGFPDETKLRVECVAGERTSKDSRSGHVETTYASRDVVWSGELSGIWAQNLDYGKYTWSAIGLDEVGLSRWKETGEFLVGMEDSQWKNLTHAEPKEMHVTLTSNGNVWRCKWPGCRKRVTSKLAAVVHENLEHRGVDILKRADGKPVPADPVAAEQAFKRRPGRPPGAKNKTKEE